jgi:hypothetical protein
MVAFHCAPWPVALKEIIGRPRLAKRFTVKAWLGSNRW